MTALIIDGNHLAYRCRYAYSLSWQGQDTSVTYGFMRVLMSYMQQFHPEIVIVGWDAGVPAWRKRLLPAYKANRSHDRDDTYVQFIVQIEELRNVLPRFGVVQARRKGIEADDLVYHASNLLDCHCVVVSGDADLLQCVRPGVDVLKPGKSEQLITHDNFEEIVGVPRQSYVWYRALQGDSSDNLKGCTGIGPKTAKALVQQIDPDLGAEQLLSHASQKIKPALEAYIATEQFLKTYSIMCLELDAVGARQTVLSSTWQRYERAFTTSWCMSWGFASLLEAGSLPQLFGSLRCPQWQARDMRIPMIWSYLRDPLKE